MKLPERPERETLTHLYKLPCPKCGMPTMLMCIYPAEDPDHDIRMVCCGLHTEEVRVKFR